MAKLGKRIRVLGCRRAQMTHTAPVILMILIMAWAPTSPTDGVISIEILTSCCPMAGSQRTDEEDEEMAKREQLRNERAIPPVVALKAAQKEKSEGNHGKNRQRK
jgi:hypothetical protein